MEAGPPPGIYQDPIDPARQRYWDGTSWGQQLPAPESLPAERRTGAREEAQRRAAPSGALKLSDGTLALMVETNNSFASAAAAPAMRFGRAIQVAAVLAGLAALGVVLGDWRALGWGIVVMASVFARFTHTVLSQQRPTQIAVHAGKAVVTVGTTQKTIRRRRLRSFAIDRSGTLVAHGRRRRLRAAGTRGNETEWEVATPAGATTVHTHELPQLLNRLLDLPGQ
jgi:hypothetical protein